MSERELIFRVRRRYWQRAIAKAGSVRAAAKIAGCHPANAYVTVRKLGLGDAIRHSHRGSWGGV